MTPGEQLDLLRPQDRMSAYGQVRNHNVTRRMTVAIRCTSLACEPLSAEA